MDIFRESIKIFDQQTKDKLLSPSHYRLLIVDGHSSHESLKTITYCHNNHIILYCLPSHTTHALQPLDVVLLSPLKQACAKAISSEEYDGRKVTKENFLKIYRDAHLQSFTSTNIITSFHKTGIWPLNPGVITAEMTSMSATELVDVEAAAPVELPSPVK